MDLVWAASMYASSAGSLVQCKIYPSDRPYLSTEIMWYGIAIMLVIGGIIEGYGVQFSWLVYAALGKALSTFQKYFMQALHNYTKKSVKGVSPTTCALDLVASILGLV